MTALLSEPNSTQIGVGNGLLWVDVNSLILTTITEAERAWHAGTEDNKQIEKNKQKKRAN